MPTSIYDDTHDLFRAAVRDFVANEMTPHFDEWEKAGIMDREIYAKAGQHGFVGFNMPESHGGGGSDDRPARWIAVSSMPEAMPTDSLT